MKKFVLSFILIFAVNAFAQEGFTKKISDLWFQGKYEEVQKIAEQRLEKNSQDIAGLLLKMECDIVFVDLDDLSLVMDRVLATGQKIETVHFKQAFPKIESQINSLLPVIASYTPEMIEEDREKIKNHGKFLGFGFALKAAEQDGLIQEE